MNTEDKLTNAIWEADALSELLSQVLEGSDGPHEYLRQKNRENALLISNLFDAFCTEINAEIDGLRQQAKPAIMKPQYKDFGAYVRAMPCNQPKSASA